MSEILPSSERDIRYLRLSFSKRDLELHIASARGDMKAAGDDTAIADLFLKTPHAVEELERRLTTGPLTRRTLEDTLLQVARSHGPGLDNPASNDAQFRSFASMVTRAYLERP